MERHPGISIHRVAVGGGVMGALFALGTTASRNNPATASATPADLPRQRLLEHVLG